MSLWGSALSGAANIFSAREASRQNRRAMQNRHQWEVRDLQRAGLNPILSARNSGTPGLPGVSAQVPDMGQTAINSKLASEQVKLIQANTRKTNADAAVVENFKQPGTDLLGKGIEGVKDAGEWLGTNAAQLHEYLRKKAKEMKRKPLTIDIKKSSKDYR